jgi:tetratricopeptide (TPR) repeat protein
VRWLHVAALACALCGVAVADDESAERAFAAAQQRAAAGDPSAIDALEELGAARPITRWTDDAWRVAAQLAERAGDRDRARRDLERLIETSGDEQAIRRARADLQRLAAVVGNSGEWSDVAERHEQLLARSRQPGDPAPALRELEELARENPRYPRTAMLLVATAQGWERNGDAERAIELLRRAERAAITQADRTRAAAELVRVLVRHGDLEAAGRAVARISDPLLAVSLRDGIERARWRRGIRWGVLAILVIIGAIAVLALRRAAGTWRAIPRVLSRPPAEVLFFAPLGIVFGAVAQTGNALVARAVWSIVVIATLVVWISGALLDAKRDRSRRAIAGHTVLTIVAMLGAIYLAIDRDRMIDLIVETWRGGPAMR